MEAGRFILAVISILVFCCGRSIGDECAPFYCSLDSNEAIEECNGVISCEPSFVPGVDGNAMACGPTCKVTFYGEDFNSSSGSVSVWFKKTTGDLKGGIWEIGQIGGHNGIGLFYTDYNDVRFEMENDEGHYEQVLAAEVLSGNEFVQIVCTWEDRGNTWYMKVFVNGRFVSYDYNWEPFDLNSQFLRLGLAGMGDWYGHCEGVIDEVRFYDWPLSDGEVYLEYVYTSGRYEKQTMCKPESSGPVKLKDGVLTVDCEPFVIKGVGYQPVPVGMGIGPSTLEYIYCHPDIIARDVNYLKKMNANTVRLWGTLPSCGAALLDALADEGMYAIMSFYVNSSGDEPGIDYSDPCIIARYTEDINDYVNTFKNHPAVLAWAIGNENNLHYYGNLADWYKLANRLARVAYEAEEPNYHPTMVVNGSALDFANSDYLSTDADMNYVDSWGHNAYTFYDYGCYFDYYYEVTAKPLVITEFGADAWDNSDNGEYQEVQAEWVVDEWEEIKENCLGGTVMEYSDEWWKSGNAWSHDYGGSYTDTQPDRFSNEEWYGLMWIEDNGSSPDIMHPRRVYCALQQAFSEREWLGDLDGDADVDFYDYDVLAFWWRDENCHEKNCCGGGADLDCNGTVEMGDVDIFADCWLYGL